MGRLRGFVRRNLYGDRRQFRAFGLDSHELLERPLEVAPGGVDFALYAAEGIGALGIGDAEIARGNVLNGAIED